MPLKRPKLPSVDFVFCTGGFVAGPLPASAPGAFARPPAAGPVPGPPPLPLPGRSGSPFSRPPSVSNPAIPGPKPRANGLDISFRSESKPRCCDIRRERLDRSWTNLNLSSSSTQRIPLSSLFFNRPPGRSYGTEDGVLALRNSTSRIRRALLSQKCFRLRR
jgi:hypothetical protein